jgi:GT2 family glycosyltransferase
MATQGTTPSGESGPAIGAVVLTMNNRPEDFAVAMASLLGQRGVRLEVAVVGNGCDPAGVPPGPRTLALPENVGIPAGRNAGAELLGEGVDYLFFLDDDAVLPAPDTLARLAAEFARHPEAAYVQPRILDPRTGTTVRRWVPRPGSGGVDRPGVVTGMAEGVVLVRRADFDAAGGWPGHYFLYHEGIDLAWRLWDLGRTGWYAPGVHIHHPATDPARHALFYRLSARNRVWVAYRNLPVPLLPVYLGAWTALTALRLRRSPDALRASAAGLREGLAALRAQRRRPMSWSTVRRLTRAGRPPII